MLLHIPEALILYSLLYDMEITVRVTRMECSAIMYVEVLKFLLTSDLHNHILKALHSGHTNINTVTVDQLKKAICWAAEGGHVDVMKYFHRGFEDIKKGSIHKPCGQFFEHF